MPATSSRRDCSATRSASASARSPCMSKLGTRANSSSSRGGASGQRSISTSSSPLTAGTSLPVAGSGRMAIVPPVETTTTFTGVLAGARGRRGGRHASPVGPELAVLLARLDRPGSPSQDDRRDEEEESDADQRDGGRRRAERVEVGTDDRAHRQGEDLERERVVAGRQERGAVVLVPREREPEEEGAQDPGPDEGEGHLPERAETARAQVARGLLHPAVVPVPDRHHDEEGERQPPDHVRPERGLPEARLRLYEAPEERRSEAEQDPGRHEREHDQVEEHAVE